MDANKSQWCRTSCQVYIPQNNENAKILVPQEKLCSLAAAAATMAPTQLLLFLKQEGGCYIGWFVHNGIELTTEPWIKLLQIHLSPLQRNWVLTSRSFAASSSNNGWHHPMTAIDPFSLFLKQEGSRVDVSTMWLRWQKRPRSCCYSKVFCPHLRGIGY